MPWEHVQNRYATEFPRMRDRNQATVDTLAWLMDRSIPIGGGYRIGLDPILGLIPGIGDVLAGLVSAFIILHAHQAGVPRITILRMLANVGIDSLLGAIPFAGDLFDFAFQSNTRNLNLYRSSLTGVRSTRGDWLFLAAVLLTLAIIVLVPVLVAIWIVRVAF